MIELLPDPERAKSILGPNGWGDHILILDETDSLELTSEEKAESERERDKRYLEKFGHPRPKKKQPPEPPASEAK